MTFISTDPNVGDAEALSLGSVNIYVEGYYASGGVTTGSSAKKISVNNLEGGELTIVSPSTVEYLLLSDTALANPSAAGAGLYAGAVAGTLRFFSVDENTGMNPFTVDSIAAAITSSDPPGAAPTVNDVSDMSMVELSYGAAVPSGFDLQYWLGATPDFTDVSAGTLVAENPFVPLSQTNYYFKCLFSRASPPLASEMSSASGLYFMPKAPDYTATHAAVTLSYTGINTPAGATVVYYVGGTASHSGLTQLPSNVFTYFGNVSPVLYFFCKLLLTDSSSTVISPATGPVFRP
jgi:hypothetical protein